MDASYQVLCGRKMRHWTVSTLVYGRTTSQSRATHSIACGSFHASPASSTSLMENPILASTSSHIPLLDFCPSHFASTSFSSSISATESIIVALNANANSEPPGGQLCLSLRPNPKPTPHSLAAWSFAPSTAAFFDGVIPSLARTRDRAP